jgi:cardiolipin synthase
LLGVYLGLRPRLLWDGPLALRTDNDQSERNDVRSGGAWLLAMLFVFCCVGMGLAQGKKASKNVGHVDTVTSGSLVLYTFPQTNHSATPLYALVNGALKTIDMTMYELVDTTFSADLVAACKRGVKVRVILDQNLEKSSNMAAYMQLNAAKNCSAAWANPAFQATHEKSMIVDGKTLVVMTLNLTTRYYTTSRDFALVETDAADIAAVQATFNADFKSTTSFAYQPGKGTDLIWSPTTATADLLGIIHGAQKTLLVENEELGAANVVSALEAACQRGVAVHLTMTNLTNYAANFNALKAAGCGVHLYASTTTGLYIHAKVMVADYGLSTQMVYLGSINFSIPSMTENRELGRYVSDAGIAKALNTQLGNDYAGAGSI